MYVGKGLRWLITLSIFACAVHAARLSGVAAMQREILETWSQKSRKCQWSWFRKCQCFGAEKLKKKWYHRTRCHCQVEQYPSKGCGQIDESKGTQTFRLSAADPETCRCISALEKSVEASGRKCQDFEDTVREASDYQLPQLDALRQQRCYCRFGEYPSMSCGEFDEVKGLAYHILTGEPEERLYRSFRLATAEPSCQCLSAMERSLERSKVVKAAAVRFCAAVVEAAVNVHPYGPAEAQRRFVQKKLGVTRELCQEVLTGTLKNFSTSQESKDFFEEANALSEHRDTKGFGHLDPLFAPPSSKKYKHMLQHVCRDECEEIVDETVEKIPDMAFEDVGKDATPSGETCADRVVRKVEAEILGCCGRACGWDEISKSCTSWPFFTKDEKVNWLEECCGEFNILQNSTREGMCDSVLTPQQAKLLRKLDTKAANGTDVGGAYLGQDPLLVWTTKGLRQSKFQSQLKKLKTEPKEGDYVTSEFLERHPKIRREGLEKGWLKEEKDIEGKKGATSLAQADSSCTAAKLHHIHHCPGDVKIQTLNNCLREEVWEVSDLPEEHDDCNKRMVYEGKVEPGETPDDCLDVDFGDVKIRRRFFLYDTREPPKGQPFLDKPILCSFEPMEHESDCEDEFDRHTLNKDRFKGFADDIHWISEEQVEIRKKKKAEDARRVQKTLADMKSS